MDKIYVEKNLLIKIGAGICLFIVGILWYLFAQENADPWEMEEGWQQEKPAGGQTADSSQAGDSIREKEAEPLPAESSEPAQPAPALLGIHVTGAVKSPDRVYYLPEGSRISEAIAAAGGQTEEADLGQLNLAGYVTDGQRVYVPRKGELLEENQNSMAENAETPLTNINLATKIELLALPGIGETYAERIIEFRETHGPFTCVEDIMQVKGIGESKFEDLKDYITV